MNLPAALSSVASTFVSSTSNAPRIRVLLTVPHLNTASPYREMMNIAKLLPRDEFDLTICALRNTGLAETGPRLASLGVPLIIAAFRPKQHSVRAVFRSLGEQVRINRLGPFDIQHSLDFTSSPFEAALARLQGRRFVFSQRNMNVGGFRGFLRLKTMLATHAVAISSSTRGVLERHGATQARMTTIYNGIDLENIEYPSRGREKRDVQVILCVGHVVPLKRQADAIRTLAMLSTGRPAAILRIVGPVFDSTYYSELVALTEALGVAGRVEFLGERPDVLALMRDADALILCSEHEAFGWVILEAMAVGLPVVASEAEGPKEIIGGTDSGFLVPVGDIPGYARALSKILDDGELAARMAMSARALVEGRFQAPSMVASLAALYRRLTAPP